MAGNQTNHCMAVWALAALLAGCSGKTPAGRDQVESEIRSARSFAAESELFLDFILEGRATRPYAVEHAAYLEEAIRQSADELRPGAADVLRECQMELALLRQERSRAAAAVDDRQALAAGKARIRKIRERLEKANASL